MTDIPNRAKSKQQPVPDSLTDQDMPGLFQAADTASGEGQRSFLPLYWSSSLPSRASRDQWRDDFARRQACD
jgi:hypothetical protein